jgi:hypothetical protein
VGGLLLLAVLLALAVYTGGTLRPRVLDTAAVERDVAAQFEEREETAVELDCADRMRVRPLAEYECDGVTEDGDELTFVIRIVDEEDAAYDWDIA